MSSINQHEEDFHRVMDLFRVEARQLSVKQHILGKDHPNCKPHWEKLAKYQEQLKNIMTHLGRERALNLAWYESARKGHKIEL